MDTENDDDWRQRKAKSQMRSLDGTFTRRASISFTNGSIAAQPEEQGRPGEKQPSKLRRPRASWRAELAGSTPTEPIDLTDENDNAEELFACNAALERTDPQSGLARNKPSCRCRSTRSSTSRHRTSDCIAEKMVVVLKFTQWAAITSRNNSTVADDTTPTTEDPGEIGSQIRIVERTSHAKRPPTYTVQLENGGEVDEIELNDIIDFVSVSELERFEHNIFAQEVRDRATRGTNDAAEVSRQTSESASSLGDSSPLSSLQSSMFGDGTPTRRRFALSPDSKRDQAYKDAYARQYDEIGIFEIAPGKYEAAINPAGINSSIIWVQTSSLIMARTIETGVDDGDNPEFVTYISQSGELTVADTGDEEEEEESEVVDNTRGTMPAHKQQDWVLLPLVPAAKESNDFVAASSTIEVKEDDVTAYVEVQRHPLMNPATANVCADLYLKLGEDDGVLVGQITAILIDKYIMDDDGKPAWMNRSRGPPPLLIDIFDSDGKALPALKKYAAHLEQERILVIWGFWFDAEYDTPDITPEDAFFAALPQLDNGYAFEGTIVVAPNQLKNAENEKSLVGKWKKSGFAVWQEWKEEETPLVLGRAWQDVGKE